MDRLLKVGYPRHVAASLANKLFKEAPCTSPEDSGEGEKEAGKMAVVSYINQVSHRVKHIAASSQINLVFSASQKQSKLWRETSPANTEKKGCEIRHKTGIVSRVDNVIEVIPLSFGKYYFSQNSRCPNVCLREHIRIV